MLLFVCWSGGEVDGVGSIVQPGASHKSDGTGRSARNPKEAGGRCIQLVVRNAKSVQIIQSSTMSTRLFGFRGLVIVVSVGALIDEKEVRNQEGKKDKTRHASVRPDDRSRFSVNLKLVSLARSLPPSKCEA